MTVKDLISILQKLPEDAIVMRDDNDDGPYDIYGIMATKVVWVEQETHRGKGYHEEYRERWGNSHLKDKPQVKGAVLI